MTTHDDTAARDYFLAALEERDARLAAEPPPDDSTAPPEDEDAWIADTSLPIPGWIAALSADEQERAGHDGAFATAMYERYHARKTPAAPRASTDAPILGADVDPSVAAYEANTLEFGRLDPSLRAVAVERALARRLGPPSAATLAHEQGRIRSVDMEPADRAEALQRAFERKGAMNRARSGGRP